MLTLQKLKDMRAGKVFAKGIIKDDRIHADIEVKWVAVRGCIHDWCIYYQKSDESEYFIKNNGDKLFGDEIIRELVSCDDEAFRRYRK